MKTKKIYIVLLLTCFVLTSCVAHHQSISGTQSKAEGISDLPDLGLLEDWLGSYEQSGILWDGINGEFNLYIYQENGKYYGYFCVHASETETSCYLDERILTEIRGSQDVIQIYFLEEQRQIRGCYHEEYPEIFDAECGESKIDQAISIYENQDLLFTLKRDEDAYSVIEGNMLLGKNQEEEVNDFNKCDWLTMEYICDNDKEVFLKLFRENERLSESNEYSCYDNEGELILSLYLDPEQESGTGIYYGETKISRYITQFDVEKWQWEIWEDPKYSLIKAGEKAATTLGEYQEHVEYNYRGKISSFYSEGIITGWGEPQKEKLVQIEFSYRDDGTLERKVCHYNHRLYGTTRQSETFYFNAEEQLNYATAYITHGMLSDYYFYEDGKNEPTYCLTLDHMGHLCYGEMVRYDNSYTNDTSLSAATLTWQDAYAELLKMFLGNNFYLCDIDSDGIPELLIGGPAAATGKYAAFYVYTYKHNKLKCLGTVEALSWSDLLTDDNGGILAYWYGAGGGGIYRQYIDDGVLYNDGNVEGYYDDLEGNHTEWFRGPDKSEIIVTEENKAEYERISKSWIELERYIATDDMIATVIYGES